MLTHPPVSLRLPWQPCCNGSACSVCSCQSNNSEEGQGGGVLTHPLVSVQLPWQLCQPAQTSRPSQPSGRHPQKLGPAPPPRQRGPPWKSAPQTWHAPGCDRHTHSPTHTLLAVQQDRQLWFGPVLGPPLPSEWQSCECRCLAVAQVEFGQVCPLCH